MGNQDQKSLECLYENIMANNNPLMTPLHKLKVRIQHAMKTNNKAELALAQDELYRYATKYNLMKDPEVLELLPFEDVQNYSKQQIK
jgi:hypothetical protein